jgi:hypothetical protein
VAAPSSKSSQVMRNEECHKKARGTDVPQIRTMFPSKTVNKKLMKPKIMSSGNTASVDRADQERHQERHPE